jgi:hypothetical protein
MAAAKLPPPTTVARVPPILLTASSTPWPAILVGVAVVVAVCLWLLFRPGSMADRARSDHPEDDDGPAGAAGSPDGDDATDGPGQTDRGGR